ncbi:conserved hypothetical protein [Brucella sp. NVSL 07-0026]|nr:conserved hypothetical protein [Brucella sp. NVSL 07-0026]
MGEGKAKIGNGKADGLCSKIKPGNRLSGLQQCRNFFYFSGCHWSSSDFSTACILLSTLSASYLFTHQKSRPKEIYMKITWLGHAAFRVETAKAVILIDPFLNGNPGAKGIDFKEATRGVTHIALTHGHGDHVGDTVAIAREHGATVIANADLASWLGSQGVEKLDPGNTGSTLAHEGFTITFVNALHSSAMLTENGV